MVVLKHRHDLLVLENMRERARKRRFTQDSPDLPCKVDKGENKSLGEYGFVWC